MTRHTVGAAAEKRWVPFAEMAGELCAMSGNEQCEADVVDSLTGAIDFSKLLSPNMGIVTDSDSGSTFDSASSSGASSSRVSFSSTREWLEVANRSGRRRRDAGR